MTILLAVNFFNQLVVISDTRISWKDKSRPPKDILRKIYFLGDKENKKIGILGFSCDNLSGAQKVINYLYEKKEVDKISRPFILSEIKDSLRLWIEEESVTNLTRNERKNLKFIFCGIEPSRSPKYKKNDEYIPISSFTETHIYVYSVNKSSGKVVISNNKRLAIIGSGKAQEEDIRKHLKGISKFGVKQQNLRWARAYLVPFMISSIFQDTNSPSVGGPIECISLSRTDYFHFFCWPAGVSDEGVTVQNKGDVYSVFNPSLNAKYTLYPIWLVNLA